MSLSSMQSIIVVIIIVVSLKWNGILPPRVALMKNFFFRFFFWIVVSILFCSFGAKQCCLYLLPPASSKVAITFFTCLFFCLGSFLVIFIGIPQKSFHNSQSAHTLLQYFLCPLGVSWLFCQFFVFVFCRDVSFAHLAYCNCILFVSYNI